MDELRRRIEGERAALQQLLGPGSPPPPPVLLLEAPSACGAAAAQLCPPSPFESGALGADGAAALDSQELHARMEGQREKQEALRREIRELSHALRHQTVQRKAQEAGLLATSAEVLQLRARALREEAPSIVCHSILYRIG